MNAFPADGCSARRRDRTRSPPEFAESAAIVGNPELNYLRALHVGAGVEYKFNQYVSLGVEGFYKYLFDRVVSTPMGLAPFYENGGIGNIYGLEVSGRWNPWGRFFGFLSYTFSRSERRDHPGDPWRLFDYDQTHIFTVAGVYRLGDGWEIGATFRLVTGNPYTPVTGAFYDVNADVYQPIYGAVNSVRNDYFHRLDLRVEKQWRFDGWSLALYLDVQNVYNAANPEGRLYNYDYRQSQVVSGLPIIPSLGIRGEL